MRLPFADWSLGRIVRVLGAIFLVSYLAIAVIDRATWTDEAPRGQSSIQFAGSRAEAVEIVESWEREGVLHRAGMSLGFDYLFLVAYGAALGALAARAGAASRAAGWPRLGAAGVVGVGAAWGGALFDAVENALIVPILADPHTGGSPALVRAMATTKYVLLVIAIAYTVAAALASRRRRLLSVTPDRRPAGDS